MKILFSANSSFYIYKFRLSIIRSLADQGYEIHIVAPKDKYTDMLKEEKVHYHKLNLDPLGINLIKEINSLYQIIRIYKKISPHIIFNSTIKLNIYGSIANFAKNSFCVNNVTGLGSFFAHNGPKKWLAIFLYKISKRGVNHIFFQNMEDMEYFFDLNIAKKQNSTLIPGSGVDTQYFKRKKSKKSKKFRFTFASRIIKEKGILDFIEASKILSKEYNDIVFNIYGSIDNKRKKYISENDITSLIHNFESIKYNGHTNDIKQVLESTDCLVLPTIYREGTPKILLEACSMEIPIIATNLYGNKRVLKDSYNGLYCKESDIINIKNKMKEIYKLDDQEKKQMGSNGRSLVIEKFDIEILTKIYKNIIFKNL